MPAMLEIVRSKLRRYREKNYFANGSQSKILKNYTHRYERVGFSFPGIKRPIQTLKVKLRVKYVWNDLKYAPGDYRHGCA